MNDILSADDVRGVPLFTLFDAAKYHALDILLAAVIIFLIGCTVKMFFELSDER